MTVTTKACVDCKAGLPVADFARDRSREDGLQVRCRACSAARSRAYRDKTPKKILRDNDRAANLKRLYGLTPETYEEMLLDSGGSCSICREPCPSGMRLAIDHDHDTLEIRGLLCCNCNRAVGLMQDDPARLRAAAAYLENPPARPLGLVGRESLKRR